MTQDITPGLRWCAADLPADVRSLVLSRSEETGAAHLTVTMEVLQLIGGGRAIVWAHDERTGRPARLTSCALPAAALAEVTLALDAGERPQLVMIHEVLGELDDGRWGLLSPAAVSLREAGVPVSRDLSWLLAA